MRQLFLSSNVVMLVRYTFHISPIFLSGSWVYFSPQVFITAPLQASSSVTTRSPASPHLITGQGSRLFSSAICLTPIGPERGLPLWHRPGTAPDCDTSKFLLYFIHRSIDWKGVLRSIYPSLSIYHTSYIIVYIHES